MTEHEPHRSKEPGALQPGLKLCTVSYVYINRGQTLPLTHPLGDPLSLWVKVSEPGRIYRTWKDSLQVEPEEISMLPSGFWTSPGTNNYSCTPLAGTELVLGVLHDLGSASRESA